MIEIYRNSTEFIGLTIYSAGELADATGTPTVTVEDIETGQVLSRDAISTRRSVGQYIYLVNINDTQVERKLVATWKFNLTGQTVSKVDYIDVVTPYVMPGELRRKYSELAKTDIDSLKELERRARLIINSYTGQDFGLKTKTVQVSATSRKTFLSEPVVRVTNVSSGGYVFSGLANNIRITNGGWVIELPGYNNQTIYGSYMPEPVWYNKNAVYDITGLFGYINVPSEVSLAAAMLVKDYSCREDMWRTRGLESVRAADWRFDFRDDTYKGTGNIDADRLLDRFKRFGAAIL